VNTPVSVSIRADSASVAVGAPLGVVVEAFGGAFRGGALFVGFAAGFFVGVGAFGLIFFGVALVEVAFFGAACFGLVRAEDGAERPVTRDMGAAWG
jgi:hypothetical protein